jgi:hypothetical protein
MYFLVIIGRIVYTLINIFLNFVSNFFRKKVLMMSTEEKIDYMRDLLNTLVGTKDISLIDNDVIIASRKLDELINIYFKEKEIERRIHKKSLMI